MSIKLTDELTISQARSAKVLLKHLLHKIERSI